MVHKAHMGWGGRADVIMLSGDVKKLLWVFLGQDQVKFHLDQYHWFVVSRTTTLEIHHYTFDMILSNGADPIHNNALKPCGIDDMGIFSF